MAKNPRIDRNWQRPFKESVVCSDFGVSLARVHWDFFATPSFKGSVPREKIAYGLAYRWLQELAKSTGTPYNRLLIGLRGEVGEQNGRFHFHCLVGGISTRNYHTVEHQAEWLWKIQSGGARIDVRQYDRSQAGADYVAKCLGANAYELSKYSFADTVTLSLSVKRLIARMDESGERRSGSAHLAKRVGATAFGSNLGTSSGGDQRNALYDETTSTHSTGS